MNQLDLKQASKVHTASMVSKPNQRQEADIDASLSPDEFKKLQYEVEILGTCKKSFVNHSYNSRLCDFH